MMIRRQQQRRQQMNKSDIMKKWRFGDLRFWTCKGFLLVEVLLSVQRMLERSWRLICFGVHVTSPVELYSKHCMGSMNNGCLNE
jgi:hypothetical protein